MNSAVLALGVVAAAILASSTRRRVVALLGIIALVLFVPWPVAVIGEPVPWAHTGVAFTAVRVNTYEAVILAVAVGAVVRGSMRWSAVFLPFVAALWVFTLLSWEQSSLVWSGTVHFTFGCLAFVAGCQLGRLRLDRKEESWLVWGLGLLVLSQFLLGLLSLSGQQFFPVSEASAEFVVGRINGSTSHPNTLGKFMVLLLFLLLPLTEGRTQQTRRLAWAVTGLALVVVALTGGRATMVGAVAMVGLWMVLRRKDDEDSKRSIIAPVLLVAAVVPFVSGTLDRFSADAEGGSRPMLLEAYWSLSSEFLPWGFGPNTYVEAMGALSPTTARLGLPVHNGPLLSLAEVGVIATLLLWVPLIAIHFLPVFGGGLRMAGPTGAYSRALVCGFPMIFVLAWTGWGMLGGAVLALWLLMLGFCVAQRSSSTNALEQPSKPSDERPLPRVTRRPTSTDGRRG